MELGDPPAHSSVAVPMAVSRLPHIGKGKGKGKVLLMFDPFLLSYCLEGSVGPRGMMSLEA
jgi:hypothetical protein